MGEERKGELINLSASISQAIKSLSPFLVQKMLQVLLYIENKRKRGSHNPQERVPDDDSR